MWEKSENKINRIFVVFVCLFIILKVLVYDEHISEKGRFLKIDKLAQKVCYIDLDFHLIKVKALRGGINIERKPSEYFETTKVNIYDISKKKLTKVKLSKCIDNTNKKYVLRKWGYEFEIEFITKEKYTKRSSIVDFFLLAKKC